MKSYWLTFGSGDPRTSTGLSPTFIIFMTANGATVTPPGITEMIAGTGYYRFQYGPTLGMAFLVDGGAALASSDRYVKGALDPIQAVDEQVGTTADSFGSTSTDPASVFGYLRRALEFWEGNSTYTKSTGIWQIYSRGSSTMLREKTLSNDNTSADKS